MPVQLPSGVMTELMAMTANLWVPSGVLIVAAAVAMAGPVGLVVALRQRRRHSRESQARQRFTQPSRR
jgi:hypothetical protein